MSGEVMQVKRIALGAVLALLLVLVATACGGSGSQIALKIAVTRYVPTKIHSGGHTYVRPRPTRESFTLACHPVSGSLPFASRVCRDIALHRQAMLAPHEPRSVCVGSPFMPTLQIDVIRGASGGGFSGSPNCGWPGGTPLAIYYAASTRDTHVLRLLEPRLRCEDDPAFFAKPTPWASVVACTRGLWTPSAERAIRVAMTSPQLTMLDPQHLFPADPGVRRCQIRGGGPAPGRVLDGLCGISLTGPPSAKIVHFVEAWTIDRRAFRHHWSVRGRTVIAQSGAGPPQLWS